LIQINNKCRYQRFLKAGESREELITQRRYHLFNTCWKNDEVQLYVNISKMSEHFQKVACTSSMCPNNCTKLGECQPKGVRGVYYTK
jgi:hypothetical protein